MGKRKRLSRSKSRKLFRNTAQKVNGKNLMDRPMRGGIRL